MGIPLSSCCGTTSGPELGDGPNPWSANTPPPPEDNYEFSALSKAVGGNNNHHYHHNSPEHKPPQTQLSKSLSRISYNAGGSQSGGSLVSRERESTTTRRTHDPVVSEEQCSEFTRKLVDEGVKARLILQDRAKTACKINLDDAQNAIVLSCTMGDKTQSASVALNEILSILTSKSDLQRIDSSAGINSGESACAALHLKPTADQTVGHCIPVFFGSADEKKLFVKVMRARLGVDDVNVTAAVAPPSSSNRIF